MRSYIAITIAVLFVSCFSLSCFAACPSMDATGDCRVDFKDFAVFAEQWLDVGIPTPILYGMTWVSISDTGISGYEGFIGEMSKYETTNAQYCQFLNAAYASGAVTVSGNYVVGTSSGPYSPVRTIITLRVGALLTMEPPMAGQQGLTGLAVPSRLILALRTIL
jgi:hypothetical protein